MESKKEKTSIKKALRELVSIVADGFKFPKACDQVVRFPKTMLSIFCISFLVSILLTGVNTGMAFLLDMVNKSVEKGAITLGVILFLVYLGRDIIYSLVYSIRSEVDNIYREKMESASTLLTARISQKVCGKIQKNVGNYSTTMEQEELLNIIRQYLTRLWQGIEAWADNLLSLFSAAILFYGVLKSNEEIPTILLIGILMTLVVLHLFLLYFRMKVTNPIRKKRIQSDNDHSNYKRDISHVPCLVNGDFETRIERFKRSFKAGFNLRLTERRNYNQNELVLNVVLFLVSSYITISKICVTPIVTLDTIAKISASLAIFNQATNQINRIMRNISYNADMIRELRDRSEDMKRIGEEYKQEERVGEIKEKMVIEAFDLRYKEASKNDKPFHLILKEKLEVNLGEVIVLTGPSASGKSTLMKVATNRVRTNQQNYYVAANRYMYFDETTILCTAVSLFEELFNCSRSENFEEQVSKEELQKMQEILEHLNLWYEIKKRSSNPWQWLMEHKFETCSNGQKQRFIIAKMLYHLSPEIDVVCLDEGTSGLDEQALSENAAGAHEVMRYIIQKCNEERKRILFISTHQKSIEAMAQRRFDFREDGDKNYIVEVKN